MAQKNARGPLDGLKVLDLTEHMAGPYCTMILADMGADVIKVERPGAGDSSRAMGDGSERNPYFRYINRNKKSLTLDYKSPRGKEILLKLVAGMDVLVENYRPTVMERAGLGYETLKEKNPRLIYAQLSGFGSDGPYREKGGFDLIAQGMGGIMHVTGEPEGPPTSVGLPICDLGTGMWGVQGILAALYERQRTGQGQRFETKDGYMMIGAAGQGIWERCAPALGHPEWLEDPRFRRGPDRRKNRFALEKEIMAVLATAPTAHWIKALDDAGVPCGPVYTYEQLFADPQVLHREMVVHAEDAELGRVPHIRTPVKMSDSAVAVRATAPKLGQHTADVLHQLGLTDDEISRLRLDH